MRTTCRIYTCHLIIIICLSIDSNARPQPTEQLYPEQPIHRIFLTHAHANGLFASPRRVANGGARSEWSFHVSDPENYLIDAFLESRMRPQPAAASSTQTNATNITALSSTAILDRHKHASWTRLILKPRAKSVAGAAGRAIANPQSRAILRKGHSHVHVLYAPEAIAVAGPGGVAHAQSDLEILRRPTKITLLPYYGGAKGQTLQITENLDGSVITAILQTTEKPAQDEAETAVEESEYGKNIKNIHRSALNIIRLQEAAKGAGLSRQQEEEYKGFMDALNQSARKLARIHEEDEALGADEEDADIAERAGLSGWFARKKSTSTTKSPSTKDKDKEEEKRKKEEEEKRKKEAEDAERKKKAEEEAKARKEAEEEAKRKRKDEEEKKRKQEEEKRRKQAEDERKRLEKEKQKIKEAEKEKEKEKEKEREKEKEKENEKDKEEGNEQGNQEETSVAEAKPVGLAVAGFGGVASSKPVATAVVGPGGLAIARPVGTAIAGVSPDQALVPIFGEKPSGSKGDKKQPHSYSSEYLSKIINKYHQV